MALQTFQVDMARERYMASRYHTSQEADLRSTAQIDAELSRLNAQLWSTNRRINEAIERHIGTPMVSWSYIGDSWAALAEMYGSRDDVRQFVETAGRMHYLLNLKL